ncbi:MAG: hypothetical protein AAB554_01405 [Patescibacteria group bacterium]
MTIEVQKPRDLWTDEEFIAAHGAEARAAPRGRPIFLGNLQRPDWTGAIPTYLIWCPPCKIRPNGGFTVAHEAGYGRRLKCSACRKRYDQLLPSRRVKDTLQNPHRHPQLIFTLALLAILTALVLR